ncbi:MAG: ABC transporter permease subunit [Flavobacteriales bacterium]|nr:ABC transporter permease subunit [Flavobacteriales bacterium]
MLTFVFTALAFLASVFTRDKARGIGFTKLLWFYFATIYDGLVLFILYAFSDYPLDKATLMMCVLNPVDLARISVLFELDMSAMLGYTGALFQQIFGSATGLSISVLLLWAIVPVWFAGRKFGKKDL